MFFALLIAAALQSDANDVPGFAQFQRGQSLIYITETVDISTYHSEPRGRLEYKVRYRWSKQIPAIQREVILNSRDCPAIREIVATMGKLDMPQPAPILDSGVPAPIMMDGNYYELKAPSSFLNGRLTITSNVGTPLAAWIDNALSSLEPCLASMPHP